MWPWHGALITILLVKKISKAKCKQLYVGILIMSLSMAQRYLHHHRPLAKVPAFMTRPKLWINILLVLEYR
jgi:hypothetical protein